MSDKVDLSALLTMLSNGNTSNMNPEELLKNFMNFNNNSSIKNDGENSSSSDSSNKDNTTSNNMPDMETIMKLMSIIKASNQNNPSKDLLNSLKPFLNDSRKEKIDKYIQILGITKALEMFNEMGDNKK